MSAFEFISIVIGIITLYIQEVPVIICIITFIYALYKYINKKK